MFKKFLTIWCIFTYAVVFVCFVVAYDQQVQAANKADKDAARYKFISTWWELAQGLNSKTIIYGPEMEFRKTIDSSNWEVHVYYYKRVDPDKKQSGDIIVIGGEMVDIANITGSSLDAALDNAIAADLFPDKIKVPNK